MGVNLQYPLRLMVEMVRGPNAFTEAQPDGWGLDAEKQITVVFPGRNRDALPSIRLTAEIWGVRGQSLGEKWRTVSGDDRARPIDWLFEAHCQVSQRESITFTDRGGLSDYDLIAQMLWDFDAIVMQHYHKAPAGASHLTVQGGMVTDETTERAATRVRVPQPIIEPRDIDAKGATGHWRGISSWIIPILTTWKAVP